MEVTVPSQSNNNMNSTMRLEWNYGDNHCLVIEEPKTSYWTSEGDSVRVSRLWNNKNKAFTGRWDHIRRIHMIPARKRQLYLAKRLDCPHYQLSRKEYKKWMETASEYSINNRNDGFLNHYDTESNNFDSFVAVVNKLTKSLDKLMDELKIQELLKFVTEHQAKDDTRGNKFVDVGFGSGKCQNCRSERNGLAIPAPLKHTSLDLIKDTFLVLSKCGKQMAALAHMNGLWSDRNRNNEFLEKIVAGNIIEAMRLAITDINNILGNHEDDNNDNEDERYSPVVCMSMLVEYEGKQLRLAIIGYSQKSIKDYMKRKPTWWYH